MMTVYAITCSLLIYGSNLDFPSILERTGLVPSMTVRDGQAPDGHHFDFWGFDIDFDEGVAPDHALQSFLEAVHPAHQAIIDLAAVYDIAIRCSMNSDLAQIGFELSPSVLGKLTALNLRLELSILSWGEVETDSGTKIPITELLSDFESRISEQ